MTREKSYFVGGLFVGLLVASLFLFYFAPRYATVKSGDTLIRQDKWTGQTWRFVGHQWQAIAGQGYDWEKIDRSLLSALRIPFAEVDTAKALKLLREKYPVLKELSDEDLLERIKLVYSKQVLVGLYLESFLKAEQPPAPASAE
jgi:hypothetical protein